MMLAATSRGEPDAVRRIIERGAPVRIKVDDGFQVLHLVINRLEGFSSGRRNIAREVPAMLLDAGADVTERGTNDWAPLHRAAISSDKKMMAMLTDAGADRTPETGIDSDATPEGEARHLGRHAAADFILDYVAGPGMAGIRRRNTP